MLIEGEGETANAARCAGSEQTLVRNALGAGLALLGIFASGLAIGQEGWTVNPGLTDGFTLEMGV